MRFSCNSLLSNGRAPRRQSRLLARGSAGAAVCLVAALQSSSYAIGLAGASLTASPTVVIADGKSTTLVTVTIRGSDGQLVPDGTQVQFTTTLGTLEQSSVGTLGGVARVHLTSAPTEGKAVVTAFAATPNGAPATATVTV